MTTRHSSTPDLSHYEALEYLKSNMAKRFDPEVVKVFCQLNSAGQDIIPGIIEEDGECLQIGPESEHKLESSDYYFSLEV
jgi:hypothetical protein